MEFGRMLETKTGCFKKQLETHFPSNSSLATFPLQPGQMIRNLPPGEIWTKGTVNFEDS